MKRTGLLLASIALFGIMAHGQDLYMSIKKSYRPCLQATQRLQVPEQIHLANPGEVPPEPKYKFSFLFSEKGVDVYMIGTPSTLRPLSALFVYQDEKSREEELQELVDQSDVIGWCCFETSLNRQNWTPIFSFKYATFDFSALKVEGKIEFLLVGATFYAAPGCLSRKTYPETLPSSQIGSFSNISPSTHVPHDSMLYRAASNMWRLGSRKQHSRR